MKREIHETATWQPMFAWWPVTAQTMPFQPSDGTRRHPRYRTVWLRRVERRFKMISVIGGSSYCAQYRCPDISAGERFPDDDTNEA